MRRLLIALFSLLLVGWLVACGEDGSTDNEGNGGNGGDGTQLYCTNGATLSIGGKNNALAGSCDNHVGICESADDRSATAVQEWYPCVEDPDCCCDTNVELDPVGRVYGCENDSCIDDNYCDALCPQGQDPDC